MSGHGSCAVDEREPVGRGELGEHQARSVAIHTAEDHVARLQSLKRFSGAEVPWKRDRLDRGIDGSKEPPCDVDFEDRRRRIVRRRADEAIQICRFDAVVVDERIPNDAEIAERLRDLGSDAPETDHARMDRGDLALARFAKSEHLARPAVVCHPRSRFSPRFDISTAGGGIRND